MMRIRWITSRFPLLFATLSALVSPAAFALDYSSVSAPAILYDKPSNEGSGKLAIVRAGTPVEIVLTQGNWVKVRDPSGDLSWIETSALSSQRTVLITVDRATVFHAADASSAAVFVVTRGVVLDYLGADTAGWVRVRHADGASGYLRINEVWGL
jgi:SH3-like domain-containing protein